jgi:hypothetical protein
MSELRRTQTDLAGAQETEKWRSGQSDNSKPKLQNLKLDLSPIPHIVVSTVRRRGILKIIKVTQRQRDLLLHA